MNPLCWLDGHNVVVREQRLPGIRVLGCSRHWCKWQEPQVQINIDPITPSTFFAWRPWR